MDTDVAVETKTVAAEQPIPAGGIINELSLAKMTIHNLRAENLQLKEQLQQRTANECTLCKLMTEGLSKQLRAAMEAIKELKVEVYDLTHDRYDDFDDEDEDEDLDDLF